MSHDTIVLVILMLVIVMLVTLHLTYLFTVMRRNVRIASGIMLAMLSATISSIKLEEDPDTIIMPPNTNMIEDPTLVNLYLRAVNGYIDVWSKAIHMLFKLMHTYGCHYNVKATYIGFVVGNNGEPVGYRFDISLEIANTRQVIPAVIPYVGEEKIVGNITYHTQLLDNTCSFLLLPVNNKPV